eukprot:363364-Chlamydomonas_euryale.AAC.1
MLGGSDSRRRRGPCGRARLPGRSSCCWCCCCGGCGGSCSTWRAVSWLLAPRTASPRTSGSGSASGAESGPRRDHGGSGSDCTHTNLCAPQLARHQVALAGAAASSAMAGTTVNAVPSPFWHSRLPAASAAASSFADVPPPGACPPLGARPPSLGGRPVAAAAAAVRAAKGWACTSARRAATCVPLPPLLGTKPAIAATAALTASAAPSSAAVTLLGRRPGSRKCCGSGSASGGVACACDGRSCCGARGGSSGSCGSFAQSAPAACCPGGLPWPCDGAPAWPRTPIGRVAPCSSVPECSGRSARRMARSTPRARPR